VLGVTGSIAAYKAADLASRLTQSGFAVETVMTESARQLVTEHTFHAVTGRPVHTKLFDPAEAASVAHIDITDRAALLVIAPATANVIARLAHGLADDVLTTMALAVRCPVIICPAMNHRMWSHPAVAKNLETLRGFGYRLVEPGAGHLACGHEGPGRLAEPEEIAAVVREVLGKPAPSAD
jgi:phosphopantothenoylcysteine decarboxylase / phosphopantothenate---cysteine ligase